MDRYLTKCAQKREYEFTKLGQAVCVLGRTGLGKTWAVHDALDPAVEITADILRSHQGTIDFLNKIEGTEINVILDEYECVQDLVGLMEIKKCPTNGIFVVISQIPPKFAFEIVTWEFPEYSPEEMRRIVPGVSDEAIQESGGDIRFLIQSMMFKGDHKDLFQGTKEFITNLVSNKSSINPIKFLGHAVHEPGNVASILHENYVDAKGIRTDVVSEYFALADEYENRVYKGDWELYPYCNMYGCVMPALEINHRLKEPLRPGSTWTKYQHMCMRTKRIATMSQRVPGKKLTIEELMLLRRYAEVGNTDILKEYRLLPTDMDVMNHLNPFRKMKVKEIANLKKSLAVS